MKNEVKTFYFGDHIRTWTVIFEKKKAWLSPFQSACGPRLPQFCKSGPSCEKFAHPCDTCLIVKAPTINETEAELNLKLNKVSAWMSANKLTLNPAKSKALITNPKLTSTTPKPEITGINGSILSTTKAKYLRVIIDDKLNFSEHVKLIETKVARAVGILGKLNYYIPQKAQLTLYY